MNPKIGKIFLAALVLIVLCSVFYTAFKTLIKKDFVITNHTVVE